MSRVTVESLALAIADAANFIYKLMDDCPDNLWVEKAGKWPIWQHVAHCCNTANFFLPGQPLPLPQGLTEAVANFEVVGTEPLARSAMREFFKAAQAKLDGYLATLNDDDLPKETAHLKPMGLDWSIIKTLNMLSGHYLYHLGNADAALRSQGHPGIF
ncbi:MAG: DinB family protein [Deltaproteobacteria bacterium]|jgi:hypothetical protein|nr:DinB family protein [Deltaproteobacteria bacterium]